VTYTNTIFTVRRHGRVVFVGPIQAFVYGQFGYREKAWNLPQYIHGEVWAIDARERRNAARVC